jgi:hypothetical protein
LEQRLNAAREAELTTVQAQLKQLRIAHRTLLANTRQEPTIREWLFAANESREAGGSEHERND